MPRRPFTEEEKQALRERLAHGREVAAERRAQKASEPQPQLTETPEFKAAVEAAVAQVTARILKDLAEKRGSNGDVVGPSDGGWAEKLASAIVNLTEMDTPGGAPKRWAPEVKLARDQAAERMRAAMIDARARDDVPVYSLNAKIILPLETGESLIDPIYRGQDNKVWPTHIRWWDVPNLAMSPQNPSARKIFGAFRESIGHKAPDDGVLEDGKPCPPTGGYIETNFGITDQGHVVTGGGIQQRKDRSSNGPRSAVIVDQANAPLAQDTGGGPAYVDVRVLGSIQPPARQNG